MSFTRRKAIATAVGSIAYLASARVWSAPSTETPPDPAEHAVIFKLKNLVLESVDQESGTITASFGNRDKPTRLVNIPTSKQVRLVASHVWPGVCNNFPFTWPELKALRGKEVSMLFHAEAGKMSVLSICKGND